MGFPRNDQKMSICGTLQYGLVGKEKFTQILNMKAVENSSLTDSMTPCETEGTSYVGVKEEGGL